MSKFTHRQLCEIGEKFLRRPESANGHGCHFAIIEPASYGENPDVIGYRHGMSHWSIGTIVLEAKTSRSDFLIDKNKPHRQNSADGMGRWRYYICPEDLIHAEELGEKWGLIHVNSRGHCKIIKGALAVPFESHECSWSNRKMKVRSMTALEESFKQYSFDERNIQNESNILTMALARLGNAEELLYMQRNHNRICMRLQNLEHQNMILERRVRGDPADAIMEAFNKLLAEDLELRKQVKVEDHEKA